LPDKNVKKVLLLSPYDAMSHRYWREGLVAEFPEHQFTVVTLPARYFSWRFRGNSLTMAHDERLQADYDLLIATSMTDLSALIGMCPSLAAVPSILYFHENQFAYPDNPDNRKTAKNKDLEAASQRTVELQMTSIYSAIAANQLVFNSAYNRNTFLEGVDALLAKMPDHVPDGICSSLERKSLIVPVPLGEECYKAKRRSGKFSILWNHRWEFDKGLDELKQIVLGLLDRDVDFVFHLAGQRFKSIHLVMAEVKGLLKDHNRLGNMEFIESRQKYLALLADSHCILSTSRHEFQGLAVQEAIASGCIPIVPDRLVYPEYVEEQWRYNCPQQAVELLETISRKGATDFDQSVINSISWRKLRSIWKELIEKEK
jgi:glycosyltransferase involved in cell wall biosynthesis